MQSPAKPLNILYNFTLGKGRVREKVIQLYCIPKRIGIQIPVTN